MFLTWRLDSAILSAIEMLLGECQEFPLNRRVERDLLTVIETVRKCKVAIVKSVVIVGMITMMNIWPTFRLLSRIVYFYVLQYILY